MLTKFLKLICTCVLISLLKVYAVYMNFTFHPLVGLWELFENNLGNFDRKWYTFWNYSGKWE